MAIADTKKAQTLINLLAQDAKAIEAIADRLEQYRGLYQAAGIDPTGTALEGNEQAVGDWINSIRAVADSNVTTGLIAAEVPTHRNKALGE